MKSYTILNSEGDILKLEIEKHPGYFTTLTLCANLNIGIGRVYIPVSVNELIGFLNSEVTLSQIVQNVKEDRFLVIRYDQGYIINRSFAARSLQCGDTLFRNILDDMKISNKEITSIISNIGIISK